MSSAHLPSQVPAITEYERGMQKGVELALKIAQSHATVDEIIDALQELAK